MLDVTRLVWRRWKGRYPTGIDRVCLAYLEHLAADAQAVVQHDRVRRIFDRDTSARLFDLLSSSRPAFKWELIAGAIRHGLKASCTGKGRLYLNLGHTGLDSAGFRQWVARNLVRPVYFVHDLIPITHPEFCRSGETARHRSRIQTVLMTAAGVIGNTQATLDELARFAAAEGLPNPPGHAAWLGTDALPAPSRKRVPDRPTFVAVGTIEARKNHLMLLNIWSRLIDRLGSDAPRLLIIGQRGWEANDVFDILDKSEKLRGHVLELNRCSDAELSDALASCRALLFPSMAEGYGLPLVEAFSLGVPVVASALPAFREIGGDIPTYLDPDDDTAWEAVILDYAKEDSVARSSQMQRMRGFKAPTWRDHFAGVDAWLRTLA